MATWKCDHCGYEWTGEAPPAKCPGCGHRADQFKQMKDG